MNNTPQVNLTEDNGGNLFLDKNTGTWFDVTPVQTDSSFFVDAAALLAGEEKYWAVDSSANAPDGKVVAIFAGNITHIIDQTGQAAQNYLRINH